MVALTGIERVSRHITSVKYSPTRWIEVQPGRLFLL